MLCRIKFLDKFLHDLFQADVDAAVKELLKLKAEYKEKTGTDYKPGASPVKKSAFANSDDLYAKVTAQGDKVRQLKSQKASKVSDNVLEMQSNGI